MKVEIKKNNINYKIDIIMAMLKQKVTNNINITN
jgi:hypothetical protein